MMRREGAEVQYTKVQRRKVARVSDMTPDDILTTFSAAERNATPRAKTIAAAATGVAVKHTSSTSTSSSPHSADTTSADEPKRMRMSNVGNEIIDYGGGDSQPEDGEDHDQHQEVLEHDYDGQQEDVDEQQVELQYDVDLEHLQHYYEEAEVQEVEEEVVDDHVTYEEVEDVAHQQQQHQPQQQPQQLKPKDLLLNSHRREKEMLEEHDGVANVLTALGHRFVQHGVHDMTEDDIIYM